MISDIFQIQFLMLNLKTMFSKVFKNQNIVNFAYFVQNTWILGKRGFFKDFAIFDYKIGSKKNKKQFIVISSSRSIKPYIKKVKINFTRFLHCLHLIYTGWSISHATEVKIKYMSIKARGNELIFSWVIEAYTSFIFRGTCLDRPFVNGLIDLKENFSFSSTQEKTT